MRHRFRLLCLLTAVLLALPGVVAFAQQVSPDEALDHARSILRTAPLIDGHNDLPWGIRMYGPAPGNVEAFDLQNIIPGQTDLRRMREGLVGGQFWSVWIPGTRAPGAARVQLEQIDIARRMIARYPDDLALALTADDIEEAFANGVIASLIGIEGGHAIENSLGALRMYYELGVRYMTLTHNTSLDWADAALDSARNNGLSPFGREVVREMNRLGMLVDLSHAAPRTMSDALDVTEAPVIFSHSGARALADHPRNVPDSILIRLAANGGVVMMVYVPEFVSGEGAAWEFHMKEDLRGVKDSTGEIRKAYLAAHPKPKATLAQVADHLDYLRRIAGPDHIGIGGDYSGSEDMPEGLEDVTSYPRLFAELILRGWSDEDLVKLAGGNILRVLRDAESVSRKLRERRPPSSILFGKPVTHE